MILACSLWTHSSARIAQPTRTANREQQYPAEKQQLLGTFLALSCIQQQTPIHEPIVCPVASFVRRPVASFVRSFANIARKNLEVSLGFSPHLPAPLLLPRIYSTGLTFCYLSRHFFHWVARFRARTSPVLSDKLIRLTSTINPPQAK